MLYTEDFSMHHYVGFSQIGSHIKLLPNISQSTIVVAQYKLKNMVSLGDVEMCHRSLQVAKDIHVCSVLQLMPAKFLPIKF